MAQPPQKKIKTSPSPKDLRVLVADPIAEEGVQLMKDAGMTVDIRTGLKEDELIDCVPNYDALVCRSGIKVTPSILKNPGKLKAIARAGVGVDNIDLESATAHGVLVLNTAEASTTSTAEHAIALLMSLARKIPQANVHVKEGKWKRTLFQGSQLAGKTAGVVGVGRIGRTVASRLLGLDMKLVGFDPYYSADRALDGKMIMIKDFDEFLQTVDIITFHVPGGDSTRHLLNRERLYNKCKPNLLVVNASRGEVVDEYAIADALKDKKIAGAAIDVFIKEPPPADHPLFKVENAILTPHLGASTDEAQQAVAVAACEAIIAYLLRGELHGAVNASNLKLDLPPEEEPFADLARRIGQLLASYVTSDSGLTSITLRASGQRAPPLMNTLLRLSTIEILKPHLNRSVNIINIEHVAHNQGITLISIHEPTPPTGLYGEVVGIRVQTSKGTHRILGTVYADRLPRVVRVDNFSMDMVPEGCMVLIENKDQPGVIGLVGTYFADIGINIADMVISREFKPDGSAQALMVLKIDSEVTSEQLKALEDKKHQGIYMIKAVKLNLLTR